MTIQDFPPGYSRYTKTHWILYLRHVVSVPGYSYLKKRKGKKTRRVRVRAYRYVVYKEALRDILEARAFWIPKADWLRGLEAKYENFDFNRSDLPGSKEKWFRLKNNFLYMHRRYPPHGPDARYTIVILYLLVWDRQDECHRLYSQRLKTLRETHRATDMNEGRDLFQNIEPLLAEKVKAQSQKMERSTIDSEGVDVKGLAAWTVVLNADYWIKEEKRREKNRLYWKRRERERRSKRKRR